MICYDLNSLVVKLFIYGKEKWLALSVYDAQPNTCTQQHTGTHAHTPLMRLEISLVSLLSSVSVSLPPAVRESEKFEVLSFILPRKLDSARQSNTKSIHRFSPSVFQKQSYGGRRENNGGVTLTEPPLIDDYQKVSFITHALYILYTIFQVYH